MGGSPAAGSAAAAGVMPGERALGKNRPSGSADRLCLVSAPRGIVHGGQTGEGQGGKHEPEVGGPAGRPADEPIALHAISSRVIPLRLSVSATTIDAVSS